MSSTALRQYLEALAPERRRALRAEAVEELDTAGTARRAELERMVRLVDDLGAWSPAQMTFDDVAVTIGSAS